MFREALNQHKDHFDIGWVAAAWEESLAADTWDGTPRWIHGNLMTGNVLVADGKLSAVIDFGAAPRRRSGRRPAGRVVPVRRRIPYGVPRSSRG